MVTREGQWGRILNIRLGMMLSWEDSGRLLRYQPPMMLRGRQEEVLGHN